MIKAKIGIITTLEFSRNDAEEADVSLTAKKRRTGMNAEKMEMMIYFHQFSLKDLMISRFLTFD
jgi:hypothetical protein